MECKLHALAAGMARWLPITSSAASVGTPAQVQRMEELLLLRCMVCVCVCVCVSAVQEVVLCMDSNMLRWQHEGQRLCSIPVLLS
jgi:hypothetical protein